jgi:hypothetical protein
LQNADATDTPEAVEVRFVTKISGSGKNSVSADKFPDKLFYGGDMAIVMRAGRTSA